ADRQPARLDDRGDLVEQLPGGRGQRRRAARERHRRALEVDPVGALLGPGRAADVRAAVVVVDAVDRLGVVRAAILGVGEAVAVVVLVGAAVLVLEAVLVLGL